MTRSVPPVEVPAVDALQRDPVSGDAGTHPPAGQAMRSFLRTRWVAVLVLVFLVVMIGIIAFAIAARSSQGRYADLELNHDELPSFVAQAPPRGVFVTIDLGTSKLRVYRGRELLREATCSVGSGVRLVDQTGGREWLFDTPIGLRTVQRKTRDPVWVKPDWAFIEEGKAPPALGSAERYDDVSLGDFALYLGDGYLIHGTLFQTLLGQAVTHGCIRLGDADLEFVYRTVPTGARVYLY